MRDHTYVVNVDGAVVRDGDVLLIERAPSKAHAAGSLAFPGGRVEQQAGGDAPLERTAARELFEEVGVKVGNVEYVCSRTFESDDGTRCLNVVTHCEQVGGTAQVKATEEVATVHWLDQAALHERADVPPYLLDDIAAVERHLGD